ncbi:MAG TPA: DNA-3-methyladenine glycosylase 2 family protein [Amycolatopsis sp.]|jgi:DNA-3-methyladenine glycosylase II|nr:DNA-3-methyladenine glycosylase 2 family protein [Amycolatopsis sp.]
MAATMSTTVQPRLVTREITPQGPFDLAASARFLAGFTPAARADAAEEEGVLRLAFPVEGGWWHAGALVRQRAPGTVEVSVEVPPEVAAAESPPTAQTVASAAAAETVAEAVIGQVRRILSLDVDGTGFAAIGRADPVVAGAQARGPGLRPVLFSSPYEAACWTIIGNRLSMAQAARIKQRIAERHGTAVEVAGSTLFSFPGPDELMAIEQPLGLSAVKVDRLHAVARAAREGLLTAESLRSPEPAEAMERLRRLPGIGPFSAQLILVRGAGHPDVFPRDEPRLHEKMREHYGLSSPAVEDLERIADGWRPYRSWVAFLLRSQQ